MPCSPRMRNCKASCLHRAKVEEWRLIHWNEEQLADAASIGYETELREYLEQNPYTTFKQFLIATKGPDPDDS